MAEKTCLKRLLREYHTLCKEPVPQVVARPLPSDILEWQLIVGYIHSDYVLEGSEGTPFAGGYYYGKIKFPHDYPYSPPSISMTTPNGRFAPHKRICLSMSDFHPETWNPIWSGSSILTGLLSFMMDEGQTTTGSIRTSDMEKRKLAKLSLAYNCESKNCPNFKMLFPEFVEKYNQPRAPQQCISGQITNRVNPTSATTTLEIPTGQENTGAVHMNNAQNRRRQTNKAVPFWQLALLVLVFGSIMALPLLQL